jgi:hypothetical protein
MRTSHPGRVSFEAWRIRIQTSGFKEHLLLVVAAYLGGWTDNELKLMGLRRAPVESIAALQLRATEFAEANANFNGDPEDRLWLRDLALVISTAAARARHLREQQHDQSI